MRLKKISHAFLREKLKTQILKLETNNLLFFQLSSHIKNKIKRFPHAHLFPSKKGKAKNPQTNKNQTRGLFNLQLAN